MHFTPKEIQKKKGQPLTEQIFSSTDSHPSSSRSLRLVRIWHELFGLFDVILYLHQTFPAKPIKHLVGGLASPPLSKDDSDCRLYPIQACFCFCFCRRSFNLVIQAWAGMVPAHGPHPTIALVSDMEPGWDVTWSWPWIAPLHSYLIWTLSLCLDKASFTQGMEQKHVHVCSAYVQLYWIWAWEQSRHGCGPGPGNEGHE